MPKKEKRVITSAYLGLNMAKVGGYNFRVNDNTSGWSDFVNNRDVIKIAEKGDIKWVHLAGDWSLLGKKGWGERVPIPTAKKLLKKLDKVI